MAATAIGASGDGPRPQRVRPEGGARKGGRAEGAGKRNRAADGQGTHQANGASGTHRGESSSPADISNRVDQRLKAAGVDEQTRASVLESFMSTTSATQSEATHGVDTQRAGRESLRGILEAHGIDVSQLKSSLYVDSEA